MEVKREATGVARGERNWWQVGVLKHGDGRPFLGLVTDTIDFEGQTDSFDPEYARTLAMALFDVADEVDRARGKEPEFIMTILPTKRRD